MCSGHKFFWLVSLPLIFMLYGGDATLTTVTFQTGRTLLSGANVPIYYNDTHDTAISTQYIDDWNNFNGETYFWDLTAPDFVFVLGNTSTDEFRVLIRFDSLSSFLTSTTPLQSVRMTLAFTNWGDPVLVQGCFMTRPWEYAPGPSFQSTGWRYSRWDGAQSVPWTQPGGWADCSPDNQVSFVVGGVGVLGYVNVSFALDAGKVAGWLANNGAANYGLLLRAVNGSSITLTNSQYNQSDSLARRPILAITYGIPDPSPPPSPAPPDGSDAPPVALAAVTFRTGATLLANGGQALYYNETHDTSITTQYQDTSNNFNGETYWWGSTGPDFTYTLGDTLNGDPADKFRVLIRFDSLTRFLPSKAVVLSAEMTVTFFNWEEPVLVQGCFMTRPWEYTEEPSVQSTGWRYSRWDGAQSVPWTQPGGWADCSPDVNISFVVPANGQYGFVSQTFALDAGKVAGWLANNGAANYGLLLRGVNGSLSLINSQWNKASPVLRRPALTISYSTMPGTQPPLSSYPITLGKISRTWYVGLAGDDENNSGHAGSPFRSPAKALFEAWPGDKIYLFSGVYPGSVDVTRSRLTIQSAPGHWAVISLPMNDPQNAVNVLTLRPGADFGVIQNLEITGGFYYGITFFTSWENYGSMAERVANGAAPSHWVIQNVSIHDTGSSAVKLVMKATNNTFANCEIFNPGARLRTAGHGIMAVQAYDLVVRDSYFHDIPAAAVYVAGGTARVLLERNYVARATFGFNIGFETEAEYMDTINNPQLYEAINVTARNNILNAISMAGINVWAGRRVILAHNTIWHAQENAQASILIAPSPHDGDGAPTSSADLTIWANVLVRSVGARAGPILQIRLDGLDPASTLLMGQNIYYDERGLGPLPAFQWGRGAMLEDERTDSTFVGNATGWAQHCKADLRQSYCDVNSVEADPKLDAAFAPVACSPTVGRAPATLPSGAAAVYDDFHGRSRPTGQMYDAGAVQANAPGAAKPLPPAPGRVPFTGVGPGPVYDKGWPYDFWLGRACKDILVDAAKGTDAQQINYESKYKKPFKTIGAALAASNQCDRILLKGGQNHAGGFGIFRPNVTITTNPTDKTRAVVVCSTTGDNPCIRTGDGLYGGAAAVQLYNFDVKMVGAASGSCIHFNEGAGSGSSAYWSFYLAARGLKPVSSNITRMSLTNCGLHGIKLSTFIRGLLIENVTIASPKAAGIEVRGGADLTIRGNTISGPGETAVRLGGGVRNVLVERNLITKYGSRGILLGSDETEVMYMDVDWARSQSPAPDWHDNINTVVRNNIIDGGAGAGIAFYSARDAVVVHNTLLGVAATMQAGVLLNVSPKQTGPTTQVGPPNTNITFKNNIVVLGGAAASRLVVEARVLQADIVSTQLNASLPYGATCTTRQLLVQPHPHAHPQHLHHHRRMLRGLADDGAGPHGDGNLDAADQGADADGPGILSGAKRRRAAATTGSAERRGLAGAASFADAYVNAPGEQGRNPDGSCPMFPATHAWHADVSGSQVHPNSDAIKANIGGGRLHPDFGGGYNQDGQRILYGIPVVTVDSRRTPMVPIDIGPDGYADESDTSPGGFPFPPDAPVEGAYLNCPDSRCGGDRHVLLVDNSTCQLYETWRSFPPGVTWTGRWQADIVARFNLSRNALGRPLGWTSADAAGLAILPGLVKWEEVVVKGVIDHAIRFTGPNSRRAYVPPATHFAPHGYQGPDAPAMGTRVRLRADFNCTPLAPAARVFCTALKKYGGIFADNGSPWYFTGEATAKWDAVLPQLYDIGLITAADMEVLDTGCLCVNSGCTVVECNGVPDIDPSALPLFPAITSTTDLFFANNIYFKSAIAAARFVDRRQPPLGPGYDGGLAGWKSYTGGDAGSMEKSPNLNPKDYRPKAGSVAVRAVPRLAVADTDFYGKSRGPVGGLTDAGAALK